MSSAQNVEPGEIHTCRVCRGVGTEDNLLFYPCRCSGTIRFVHQECLANWVRHSGKHECDICGYRYLFEKVYNPDAPISMPVSEIAWSLLGRAVASILLVARAAVALVLSLVAFPYSTLVVWRMWFDAWPGTMLTREARERLYDFSSYGAVAKNVYSGYMVLLFLACIVALGISLLFLARHVVLNTQVGNQQGRRRRDAPIVVPDPVMNEQNALQDVRDDVDAFQGVPQPPPDPPAGMVADDDAPLPPPLTFDDVLEAIGVKGRIFNMVTSFGIAVSASVGLTTFIAFATYGPMTLGALISWVFLDIYLPNVSKVVKAVTSLLQKATDPILDPLMDALTVALKSADLELNHAVIDEVVVSESLNGPVPVSKLADFLSDDSMYILIGYSALIFAFYLYARQTGMWRHPYFAATIKALIGNVKVLFFIVMDFFVMRPYCGWLVDLCLSPVFGPGSSVSQLLNRSRPLLKYGLYWLTGTVTMFQFIMYIEIARKLVRPGLLWFTLNPENPQFNPLQRFRERPFLKGMSTVVFNAVVCTSFVIFNVGGFVTLIRMCQAALGLDSGMLCLIPLRWEIRDPISDLSAAFLFVSVGFPLAKYMIQPKKQISALMKAYFHYSCRRLRISHFLLGERAVEEENGEIGLDDPLVVQTFEQAQADPVAVTRGRKPYLRVPKHDQIVKMTGDKLMLAMSRTDPLVGMPGETENDVKANWMRVYIPDQFRLRVLVFLIVQWLLVLFVLVALFAVTLISGRLLCKAALQLTSFADVLDRLVPLLNLLKTVPKSNITLKPAVLLASNSWKNVSSGRPDLLVNDAYALNASIAVLFYLSIIVHWVFTSNLWRFAENVFKASFVSFWAIAVSPLVCGVCSQVLIVLPFVEMEHHHPASFLVQSWWLGAVICVISQFTVKRIPEIGFKRALTEAQGKIWNTGIHDLNLASFTIQIIAPVLSFCVAIVGVVHGAPYLRGLDGRYSTHVIAAGVASLLFTALQVAESARNSVRASVESVRNERYLIGLRLQNLAHEHE
ncbi:hypothetical protein BC830DRAFT_1173287 [Chytriomyces sp. MP71]|nr:hypothetical protein BC830DRAFT_1173287 [Chytriomyces sp. MP71]